MANGVDIQEAAKAVKCPACKQRVGDKCVTPTGKPAASHGARVKAFEKASIGSLSQGFVTPVAEEQKQHFYALQVIDEKGRVVGTLSLAEYKFRGDDLRFSVASLENLAIDIESAILNDNG